MEETAKLVFQAVKDLGLPTVLVLLFIAIGFICLILVARFFAPIAKDWASSNIAFVNKVDETVQSQKLTQENTCEAVGSIEKIQLSILKSQEQITAAMQQLADADRQNAETLNGFSSLIQGLSVNQEAILKILTSKAEK